MHSVTFFSRVKCQDSASVEVLWSWWLSDCNFYPVMHTGFVIIARTGFHISRIFLHISLVDHCSSL